MSKMSKIYERIIETELERITEPKLQETQSGFRKGPDHILIIKQLIEKIIYNVFYVCFLLILKKLSTSNHEKLFG